MAATKPYQEGLTDVQVQQLQKTLNQLADGNPGWVDQLAKVAEIKATQPVLWTFLKSKL